jgi:hypothetical protein
VQRDVGVRAEDVDEGAAARSDDMGDDISSAILNIKGVGLKRFSCARARARAAAFWHPRVAR